MRILILFLAAVALAAQQTPPEFVSVTFTWQNIQISDLHVYMAGVCNTGPMSATVLQARDVWPAAAKLNLNLQGPVAILQAEQRDAPRAIKAWVLWGVAGGCAVAAAVTNGGAVALDPTHGWGKVVAYGTASCAIGLPIIAESIKRAPTNEVTVPEGDRLPATFLLGAGDCKQGYVFASLPFNLKVLP